MKTVWIFVAALCACAPTRQAQDSDPEILLSVEPDELSAGDSATLVLRNGSAGEIGYNLCTSGLERSSGTGWQAVPSDRVCTMELRTLRPGQTVRHPTQLPRTLPPGEYRYHTAIELIATGERMGVRSEPFRVPGVRQDDSAARPAAPVQAPWQQEPLAPTAVPPVYPAQWKKAENRETCALMAPAALGPGSGARARAAHFGGGWGVAYDLPQIRSAFGVAGTGASADAPSYSEWPHTRRWSDGSRVGYGPEGGTGPNQLAYLRVRGQECLYNVWSRLGVRHLEYLLEQLRFVSA